MPLTPQAFLTKSEGTFRDHPVWASAPPDHQSQAMEVLSSDAPVAAAEARRLQCDA